MSDVCSVLLAGVGGQGILLASNIIAGAALLAGHDVKTNEVHGMAQRGGSVVAEIRYGGKVRSPLIGMMGAHALAAFEQMEALRYAQYLTPGGLAVVSKLRIVPAMVSSGHGKYPEDIEDRLRKAFRNLHYLDTAAAAERSGSPRAGNLVVLGALSKGLDLPETLWEKAITKCVKPEFVSMNVLAFNLGRQMVA